MSILHGNTNRIRKSLGHNYYGIGINTNNDKDLKRVNNYFKRGQGELDIKLIEKDDAYAVFEFTMNSKTLDKPIKAQIESRIDNLTSTDNPQELVNQATGFLNEAVNDIFNYSYGNKSALVEKGRIKENPENMDYIKMGAMATKLQDKINSALTYGCDLSNKIDKEKVKEYKSKNSFNLNQGFNLRPAM